MCLIVFDWRPAAGHGPFFTLSANRDEYFRRTAEPLGWWADAPGLLAGRDLAGGGTWLGVSRDGRFAALTNYRAPHDMRPDAPTRGTLVSAYLQGAPLAPLDYLHRIAETGAVYNGFNLLIGDFKRRELGWYCNRSSAAPILLDAGAHAISNAVLDTPWPKLVRKRDEMRQLLEHDPAPPLAALIELMRDPRVARDDELPATGLTLERERALSAAFIETPDYGTRGTTALRVNALASGLQLEIAERSDDDGTHRLMRPGNFERSFSFDVERASQPG
ncbi:NRDE family protein [Trinickia terrae]|uniref:NRDE family protein n=1 Tax=Trinickia terrae TaxID=2571161 RepID=A0A4U1I226_9BURK|nr:NRDE family protein [Trinickia terrae]TKC87234.1 NRDE family protein [Trinickia terrae]